MNRSQIEELEARISASPGWTLGRELSGLARTYRLFLANDAELRGYLHQHGQLPTMLELWDVKNRDGFERFLDEVDRLFHNYVAAAGTLRDHTRRVWQEYAPLDAVVRNEYELRIEQTFATSPVAQFVLKLRNYTIHRRLPVARGRLSWMKDESFDSIVFLGRGELLAWDGWSAPARHYLNEADKDVNLAVVVDEYSNAVVDFNTWFGKAYVGGHLPAFDELERLKRELAAAWASESAQ